MIASWCWISALIVGQPLLLVPPPPPATGAPEVPSAPSGRSQLPMGRVDGGSDSRPVRKPSGASQRTLAEDFQGEWQAPLKLVQALEHVYRGTVTEECFTPQTQYSRSYRLESRVLVLQQDSDGAQLAFLTSLREKEAPRVGSSLAKDALPSAVRLAKGQADSLGKLEACGGSDGLGQVSGKASHEVGMVVELPPGKLRPGEPWESVEKDLPPLIWSVKGKEVLQGMACLMLHGEQKTETWDKPRADQGAWRRVDKIWLSQRTGLAAKVERVIEKREPARQEIAEKTTVRYELDSSLQYPGPLFEDRVRDVDLTLKLSQNAEKQLAPGSRSATAMASLLKKTEKTMESYPPTPYRAAFAMEKKRAEAVLRGEIPPPETGRIPTGIAGEMPLSKAGTGAMVSRQAPDFSVPRLGGTGSLAIRGSRGSQVLMVFFNPQAPMTEEVLLQVKQWRQNFSGEDLVVLPLTVRTEEAANRPWVKLLGKETPIYDGSGLRITYGVEVTPRLVLVDRQGVIRALHEGWGGETRQQCAEDLRLMLAEGSGQAGRKDPGGR